MQKVGGNPEPGLEPLKVLWIRRWMIRSPDPQLQYPQARYRTPELFPMDVSEVCECLCEWLSIKISRGTLDRKRCIAPAEAGSHLAWQPPPPV